MVFSIIIENELDEFEESFFGEDEDNDDSFGGKWKAKRAAKQEAKATKKADKNERKNTRVNSKAAARDKRSEARLIKSQNGDTSGSGSDIFEKVMGGIKTVGGAVGQMRGKGESSGEETGGGSETGGDSTGDKLIMGIKSGTFYIIAGVTGLIVVVGLYLAFKPKSAKAV